MDLPPDEAGPSSSPNIPNVMASEVQNTTGRKKMFRFSARDDVELLKAAIMEDPYRAKHGFVLSKWEAVCRRMKLLGMNVDYRRCRDRVNLLLQQYREKEFDCLRKSGTPDEYQEKERLLHDLSQNLEMDIAGTNRGTLENGSSGGTRREKKRSRVLSPFNGAVMGKERVPWAYGVPMLKQRTQDCGNGAGSGENDGTDLAMLPYLERLEEQIRECVEVGKRHMELERKRVKWETEKENRRLVLEKEKMLKEFEDRKAERELKAKLWEAEQQERNKMMKLILDLQRRNINEPGL